MHGRSTPASGSLLAQHRCAAAASGGKERATRPKKSVRPGTGKHIGSTGLAQANISGWAVDETSRSAHTVY